MKEIKEYLAARDEQIKINMEDRDLKMTTSRFFREVVRSNWVKQFTWMGIPIMQLPGDLMVMQEIIWEGKFDWIIETGTAFGGMTLFYATCPTRWTTHVLTIDKDIRPHARKVLTSRGGLHFIEGDSVSQKVIGVVKEMIDGYERILVSLDSNHTQDHVLAELRLYSPLVSVGSYIIIFDTTIEEYGHFDPERNKRPWGPGNNPASAVKQFLQETDDFVVDKEVEQRALITAAPGGFLRRVK